MVTKHQDQHSSIASAFRINGTPVCIRPIGNGHINDTYLVECSYADTGISEGAPLLSCSRYVLQRINENVFGSPDDLMDNIVRVTEYLGKGLRIIPARSGSPYLRTENGCWRMMNYIEGSFAPETCSNADQFMEIGRAYGSFISDLSDFPAGTLHETIKYFHDTRQRFQRFITACRRNIAGRAENAAEEIRFALGHEKHVDILNDSLKAGEMPLRVTHNDTKINNVLLDRETEKAICVIDLDTVMPGLAVNDFGDAIRSGAATGREDETNYDAVRLDLDMYRAFAKGFIEGFPDMTEAEIKMMPAGARMMTLECGLRFLTDYLEGDHYFKTDYPEHNLVRCRTQFRLLRDMEDKREEMSITGC